MERKIVRGVCIDGPFTKVRDDAIWAAKNDDGYTITVSIADVAALVAPGSSADQRAYRRAFTTYNGTGPRHMLPEEIVRAASLDESGRQTLTVSVTLDEALHVRECRVEKTILEHLGNYSFTEADSDILHNHAHPLHAHIRLCGDIAERLRLRRRSMGAIVLDRLDEEQPLERAYETWRMHAHAMCANHIVEEFVLLAGRSLAHWCLARGIPVLFRNHSTVNERSQLLKEIEGAYHGEVSPDELVALQARVAVLFSAAYYSPYPDGHQALNMLYAHCTSPLRRYADLVVHQQIACAFRGEAVLRNERSLLRIAHRVNTREREIREHDKAYQILAQKVQCRSSAKFIAQVREAAQEASSPGDVLRWHVFLRARSFKLTSQTCFDIMVRARSCGVLWREIKRDTLAMLAHCPRRLRAVFGIAHAKLGWPLPVIDTIEDERGRFLGIARLEADGKRFAAASGWCADKKRAADEAALALLGSVSGLPDPRACERLRMYCARRGLRQPRYALLQSKKGARPFMCVARTNVPFARTGPIVIAWAATESEARSRAAEALLARIVFEM